MGNLLRIVGRIFAAPVVGGLLGGALVVGAIFVALQSGYLLRNPDTTPPITAPGRLAPQTEALFLNGLDKTPSSGDEWWSARSDHRLVAYAVLSCKGLGDVSFDMMPRQYFSSLLLDLTGSGNHVFNLKSADETAIATRDKGAPSFSLAPSDLSLLALSDSISRARIAAADGAITNVPWVRSLGWLTVVVSALATLFVTLQGKMKPVELEERERKSLERAPLRTRLASSLFGAGSGFRWVAFLAITLSITGTSLNGLRQVYDPARTLTLNSRALLELRQLHQDVIVASRCREEDRSIQVDGKKMEEWTASLKQIRAAVVPDYVAYAALEVRPGGSANAPRNAEPPSGIPIRVAQTISAAPHRLGKYENSMSVPDIKALQASLCVPEDGDLGSAQPPSSTRTALSAYLTSINEKPSLVVTPRIADLINENLTSQKKKSCDK